MRQYLIINIVMKFELHDYFCTFTFCYGKGDDSTLGKFLKKLYPNEN